MQARPFPSYNINPWRQYDECKANIQQFQEWRWGYR